MVVRYASGWKAEQIGGTPEEFKKADHYKRDLGQRERRLYRMQDFLDALVDDIGPRWPRLRKLFRFYHVPDLE